MKPVLPLPLIVLLAGCGGLPQINLQREPKPAPVAEPVETVTLEIVSYEGMSCEELSDLEAAEIAFFASIPSDQPTQLRAAGARIEQIRAAKVTEGC